MVKYQKFETRHTFSRNTKCEELFLKDNPHLEPIFKKLENHNITSFQDIPGNKIQQTIKEIMIKHEIKWRYNTDPVFPSIKFTNHRPLKGDFGKAIPKILKELNKLTYKG